MYLLDTCTFYWLCANPDQLPARISRTIQEEYGRLHISMVTQIEVMNLWLSNKMRIERSPRNWFRDQIHSWNIRLVRIDEEDIFRASELPSHHRDPFDRLLVAQAIIRNLTILTPDTIIHRYPVSTLW